MEIKLTQIKVRDLVRDYKDNQELGIVGYGGKLDIRPPYQREFIYNANQREAVIDTVYNGFPLNVMYWGTREDGSFEVIDGQQRTISLCQYVSGEFSYNMRYFGNLQLDEQAKILNYELQVYVCTGTDSEKLKWFKTINIAGEKLTNQELLNAVYAGPWLSDAKRHFSKSNCPAYQMGKDYVSGSPIRQDFLETALRWISEGNIEVYMGKHQKCPNANELWLYFQSVIAWVTATFPKKRKEMKCVDWGELYNQYKDNPQDSAWLETEVARLMQDSDVTAKKGIYPYLLTGKEKHLNIRAFDDNMKREVYERQLGICPCCGRHYEIEEMHADHITPWSKGGRTIADNCQMLCADCNRKKGNK